MLNRTAIFFPLVLAGLMALLTFWIYQTVEEQGTTKDGSNRHDPDYFMDNFITTQTDTLGKLRYILAAEKMTHYPDDDTTVLVKSLMMLLLCVRRLLIKVRCKYSQIN